MAGSSGVGGIVDDLENYFDIGLSALGLNSAQHQALYKASGGNVTLYQQAVAQSDSEQSRLDAIHAADQLKTLGDTVGSLGGKVALGLGVGSGALLVVAALAAFAYFKLEKAV